MKLNSRIVTAGTAALAGALALGSASMLSSCGKRKSVGADGKELVTINAKGSDTMIQLSAAWSEAYGKAAPNVQVNASGGGSGTGIAALQNGTVEICFSSREMKPTEKEQIKATSGKEAVEFAVAYDALALYTHASNPLKEISVEELQDIWSEDGAITKWEQVDPGHTGDITLVGRQNNSGTYDYFREHVCGKDAAGTQRELRKGISELNGSAEVVETVAKTPSALGYSGMGYKLDSVNWLAVSNKKGEPGVLPGVDAARSGKYPIARKLYLYTTGEPQGEVRKFIDWCLSEEGQAIVAKEGFVPLK